MSLNPDFEAPRSRRRRLLVVALAGLLMMGLAWLLPSASVSAAPTPPAESAAPLIDPLYNPTITQRLKLDGVTTSRLTSHRLTHSHLFTQSPGLPDQPEPDPAAHPSDKSIQPPSRNQASGRSVS